MSLAYSESVLNFPCKGESLLGIVSKPLATQSASDIGVIIVVGGPQYRVGSHRLFVSVARSLAAAGITAMRFDYRGMGDSSGAARDFLAVTPDINAAIDALMSNQPHLRRIVLWGLCDAASAILLHIHSYGRTAGLHGICLVNPWVRSVETLARARVKHYYRERLMQQSFWLKLLRGQVAINAICSLLKNLRQAASRRPSATHKAHQPFPSAMAAAMQAFEGPTLLLLSGQDLTAQEFLDESKTSAEWARALLKPSITKIHIPLADHTFSGSTPRLQMEQYFLDWVRACAAKKTAEFHHE